MAWFAIAAAAVSAASKIQEGNQQAALATYQAKAAEAEGRQAQLDATEQAARIRRQVGRVVGTGRVFTGAAGIDPTDGSAIDAAADVRAQGELDALTTIWQGDIAARRLNAQSGLYQDRAASAVQAGYLGAGKSALGGLAAWKYPGSSLSSAGKRASAGTLNTFGGGNSVDNPLRRGW